MSMIEKKLKYLVDRIACSKKVSAIFLFGSRVTGRARSDSDFDIAVLTKNMPAKDEKEITGLGDDVFDIHIFSQLPLLIQFRVLKEGKILYSKSEKDIYDTKVDVFRRYLDFSSRMNLFYRKVLRNV